MQTLQILDASGEAVVSIRIADIDPQEATVVVLNALATIKPKVPRKTRSDSGKSKTKADPHAMSADATE